MKILNILFSKTQNKNYLKFMNELIYMMIYIDISIYMIYIYI